MTRSAPGRRRRWPLALALLAGAFVVVLGAYVASVQVPGATPPWTRGAPMPTLRSEMPAALHGGTIYVAGGLAALGRTTRAFEAYDVAADAWRRLPDLPAPRHHAGAAATEDLVVVTGGFEGLDFAMGTSDVFGFVPSTGTWTSLPPMPGRRGAHTSVAIDGLVYVIGGVGDDPSAVWSLDPVARVWRTDHARLPTVREHLDAAVVAGVAIVVGGRWPGRGILPTAEAYDPAAERWTTLPDLPRATSGHRAVAVHGRLHVLGGEDLAAGQTFAAHQVYVPEAGAWVSGPPLVAPRHGIAAAAVGDRIVVIGGGTRPGALTLLSMTRATDVLVVPD